MLEHRVLKFLICLLKLQLHAERGGVFGQLGIRGRRITELFFYGMVWILFKNCFLKTYILGKFYKKNPVPYFERNELYVTRTLQKHKICCCPGTVSSLYTEFVIFCLENSQTGKFPLRSPARSLQISHYNWEVVIFTNFHSDENFAF